MEYPLMGTVRQILAGPIVPADIDGRDELTGAYDTKSGVLRLDEEARRALRFRHSLSCFILEVDGLKAVAETHGHRRAECVIQDIGTILRHSVRSTDVVYRLDAERFLLITPRLDAPSAQAVSERIRQAVSATPIRFEDGIAILVTVSIGCTGGGDERLVERADAALYAAKKAGRDRTVALEPSV